MKLVRLYALDGTVLKFKMDTRHFCNGEILIFQIRDQKYQVKIFYKFTILEEVK